jgi:uncharacterized surface protein with fasciclin (FAS1) repeats
MKIQHRIARLGVSLAALGLISSMIPQNSGTAFAQRDRYLVNQTNNGIVQGAVVGLVGYGLYGALKGGGSVVNTVPSIGTTPSVVTSIPVANVPPVANPTGMLKGMTNVDDPIYDAIRGQGDTFSSLLQGIDTSSCDEKGPSDLVRLLRKDGPYTVFAATNGGFSAAYPSGVLAKLLSIPADLPTSEKIAARAKLRGILEQHIVRGRYTIADLKRMPSGTLLTTLSGSSLKVTNDGGLKVNGVKVVESDIPARNGVIHPLEGVFNN